MLRLLNIVAKTIVGGFHQIENDATVSNIDSGTAEFLVECGVMEQIEILQQEESGSLEIGIQSQQGTQVVERFLIHLFGMLYQVLQIHILKCSGDEPQLLYYLVLTALNCYFRYQLATVALNIWSTISSVISVTRSSCTEFRFSLES